ncbi:MAG: 30S ribosomal protein S9 [Candidatus Levybacteria bacterium]|nr:30S ribosomal protein S9 [Candidatus Levybacteria bacterium]
MKKDYIFAVGRKKESSARVRLYPSGEKGVITVNGQPIETYFPGNVAKAQYMAPFFLTKTNDVFMVTVKVAGGGKSGQLSAVTHGIARALALYSKDAFRPILKLHGLLTRDARVRERRKVGTGGKARRQKQSPKR